MKLFVLLRYYYKILGICPIETVSKYSFNLRNCLILFFVLKFSIAALVYLFVEARTFQQCADSFYTFSTTAANGVDIFLMIWNMTNIFELIDNLEKEIQQRNLQSIYNKLNEKIEQFSKSIYFIFVHCTFFGIVMPNFLTTFFVYFTTNLGSDAFQLPFLVS